MEGGRQADVAKGILCAKNFPYIVAAPLLLQVRLVTALAQLTGQGTCWPRSRQSLSLGSRLNPSCLCFRFTCVACVTHLHGPPAWPSLLALHHLHVLPQASHMMFLACRIRAARPQQHRTSGRPELVPALRLTCLQVAVWNLDSHCRLQDPAEHILLKDNQQASSLSAGHGQLNL